jgi:putative ABC transport system permease protein
MQDLRDAIRGLRRSPLLTAAAILSLTLGIGANTAIFSILNSLLLKPLPVREPGSLVAIASDRAGEDAVLTYPVWQAVRDAEVLTDPFVWASDRVSTEISGNLQPLDAIWASGRFFEVLGLTTIAGRPFAPGDDRPGGAPGGPVAVLSYRAARRLFHDPAASIGRTLTVERVGFTVVGVTPPNFFGLNVGTDVDVVLPLETEPMLNRIPSRREMWPWLHITARLAPEVSLDEATAALRAAQPRIRDATMPDFSRAEDRDHYLRAPWTLRSAGTGSSRLRSRYQSALVTLLAIVGLVLLVACVNIAHLQLARAAARRYEFAVRLAVGSGRRRIVRLQLIESVLLSTIGAACGIALSGWAAAVIVAQLSTWVSTAFLDLSIDWRVLAVTAAVAVSTAILFGTVPAIRAARVDPIEALNKNSRRLSSASLGRTADLLVIGQIALSLVLVLGAALFVRSFATLVHRDLGFDRDRVLTAVVDSRQRAVSPGDRMALYDRVRHAVADLGGVESTATSMATPLGSAGIRFSNSVAQPGNPTLGSEGVLILTNPVSPGWLRTFGTRLVTGRDIEETDTITGAPIVLVNEAFARKYFAGVNPVGRSIMVGSEETNRRPTEIVGVVEDAAFTSVRDPIEPTLYRPLAQAVDPAMFGSFPSISLSIRSVAGLPPARLANSVSAAVSQIDPALTVSFQALTDTLRVYYIRERLLALLSGYFGIFALLLGAVGIYGVTAHSVSRRRTELGIRMAIGASGPALVRAVIGRLLMLCAAGIMAGCLIAFWAGEFVRALLFDTTPRDPLSVLGSVLALILAAVAATWIPARRATRLDPADVLRDV